MELLDETGYSKALTASGFWDRMVAASEDNPHEHEDEDIENLISVFQKDGIISCAESSIYARVLRKASSCQEQIMRDFLRYFNAKLRRTGMIDKNLRISDVATHEDIRVRIGWLMCLRFYFI